MIDNCVIDKSYILCLDMQIFLFTRLVTKGVFCATTTTRLNKKVSLDTSVYMSLGKMLYNSFGTPAVMFMIVILK